MKQEINPQETNRAIAFELWMKSPMPMVTLTKTFDVTRLCKIGRRRGMKFNMLLCWCIGQAASRLLLPILSGSNMMLLNCRKITIFAAIIKKSLGNLTTKSYINDN